MLLTFGLPLGSQIKELIGIVSPRTFTRWVNAEKTSQQALHETGAAAPRPMRFARSCCGWPAKTPGVTRESSAS